MGLRNIRLSLEYDGSAFSGWQVQPGKKTVQGALEEVLRRICRTRTRVRGASRTDAGVHALGQVATFRTRSRIPCRKFLVALNGLLPKEIVVTSVRGAPPSFHAIRDAKRKVYRYLIWNHPVRSVFKKDRAWHVWDRLDLGKMRRAARFLIGRHDFAAFRGTRSDTKTSIRTIYRISLRRKGGEIRIDFEGNGFLKYMVRNIVGTLVEIGKGRRDPGEMKGILRSRERKKAGVTAPAAGLYLIKVRY